MAEQLRPKSETPDQEARRLRDMIYATGETHQPIRDPEWETIKGNWVRDIGWLREKARPSSA